MGSCARQLLPLLLLRWLNTETQASRKTCLFWAEGRGFRGGGKSERKESVRERDGEGEREAELLCGGGGVYCGGGEGSGAGVCGTLRQKLQHVWGKERGENKWRWINKEIKLWELLLNFLFDVNWNSLRQAWLALSQGEHAALKSRAVIWHRPGPPHTCECTNVHAVSQWRVACPVWNSQCTEAQSLPLFLFLCRLCKSSHLTTPIYDPSLKKLSLHIGFIWGTLWWCYTHTYYLSKGPRCTMYWKLLSWGDTVSKCRLSILSESNVFFFHARREGEQRQDRESVVIQPMTPRACITGPSMRWKECCHGENEMPFFPMVCSLHCWLIALRPPHSQCYFSILAVQ